MLIYVDSSALLKRALEEAESDALDATLASHVDSGDVLVASSLAWVEVSRAVRTVGEAGAYPDHRVADAIGVSLSGISERPVSDDVISVARRIAPPVLRSLDAIHLATALLIDADEMVTYDDRLAEACRHNGLTITAPGRPLQDD